MDQLITIFQDPENVGSAGAIYGFVGAVVDERNNIIDHPIASMYNIGFSSFCYGVGAYFTSHLVFEKARFAIPIVLGLSAAKYIYQTYKDPTSVEKFVPFSFKLIKTNQ